jgi:hypothetical protein
MHPSNAIASLRKFFIKESSLPELSLRSFAAVNIRSAMTRNQKRPNDPLFASAR